MLEWINNRFNTNLNESNLYNVKNFALIWNIFEGRICDSHFTIGLIEERLTDIEFNIEDFEPFISYFKDRYTTNGEMNNSFHYLYFRNGDRRDFVQRVLLGEEIPIKDCVLATTIIVYRLRNNLFHGLKEMHSIDGQRDNFNNANQFLMKLVDVLDS